MDYVCSMVNGVLRLSSVAMHRYLLASHLGRNIDFHISERKKKNQ
jgi:hypothetical protein